MKGLVAGYASSGDEASSSDDEPAKPPRAAVREGPRAGRRESRWAIQARAILPPEIRAALEGGAAWSDDDDGAAPAAAAAAREASHKALRRGSDSHVGVLLRSSC